MWETKAQFPEGILVMLGTPESVEKVASLVSVLGATPDATTVTSPVFVPFGDHCLYVGVPYAVFVLID